MIRAAVLIAWCAALSVACGDEGSETEPGTDETTTDTEPEAAELRIDMRPVDAITINGVFEPDAGQTLRATQSFALALHDDYPAAVDVTLAEQYATCGSLDGTFTIDAITSQDADLGVTITGPGSFRIAPTREGDFEAVVSGHFIADADSDSCVGDEADFEVIVAVPVRRPVGVRVEPPSSCAASSRLRMETEAHLDETLLVVLVDDAGESFQPRNAEYTHPATLTLTTGADTLMALHTPDEGLAALVVSGAPGMITISAFDAPHETIEHVAPASIDVVGVGFGLLGYGGGSTPLANGEVYGAQGWSRTSASIGVTSSGLEVDGEQLCTVPRPGAFVLGSATPDVCVAYAEFGHGDGLIGASVFDPAIEISAEMIASGVCTLQLDAPSYSDGAGFSTAFSVEILNAESLYRADEGR